MPTVPAISKGQAVLIRRSGEAVLINLILLLVCSRPNVFCERAHISQQFKNFIHRWPSSAVHLTAALSPIRSGTRPLASVSGIAGLTVSHN